MHPVKVTLTNEFAYITDADDGVMQQLSDRWSYFSLGAPFNPAYRLYQRTKGKRGWDGKVRMLSHEGTVPAGVYRATKRDIKEELGIRFKTTKDLPDFDYTLPDLDHYAAKYIYQHETVMAMCRAVRRGGGIILNATGTGKTKIAGDFFGCVKCHCLFVVNRITLLHQTQKELESWLNEEVGIVGDSEFEVRRVTVATIQTLQKRYANKQVKAWLRKVAIVVVDELHKQMARSNFRLLNKIQPVARYGLTATLEMRKAPVRMRAWAFAGPVIYEFPYDEGRKNKVLSDGRALQLRFPVQDEAYGNYQEEYRGEVVENKQKLAACSAVVRYLLNEGRYVVVLVHRRKHVTEVRKLFRDLKYGLAYGKVNQAKRAQRVLKFEAGDIRLLIASSVFEEGVNIKRVDAIVDLAEFKSKNTALQKFGRGVRLHTDKDGLIYIDFGSQDGRYRKAAGSRARAFRAQKVEVKVVKVAGKDEAVAAVKKFMARGNNGGKRERSNVL